MAPALWIGAGMVLSIVSTVLALSLLARARGAGLPVPSGRSGGPDTAARTHGEVRAEPERRAG